MSEHRVSIKGEALEVRVLPFEKKYKETGAWGGKKYDVNYSSILSRLITDAGRFCLSYASDLFIWWGEVVNNLSVYEEDSSRTAIFGICENGVDNACAAAANIERGMYHYYRSIWGLKIEKKGNKLDLCLEKLDKVVTAKSSGTRIVSQIEWATDGKDAEILGLPNEVSVPFSVEDDAVADWLSDSFGYCVKNYITPK